MANKIILIALIWSAHSTPLAEGSKINDSFKKSLIAITIELKSSVIFCSFTHTALGLDNSFSENLI